MLICVHCMQKVLGCMKIVDTWFVSNICLTKEAFFLNIKIGKSKSWTQIVVWKRKFVVLQVCARTHRDVIMFNNACLWFFRKSKNINHNNRHIAFWNIRVAALRTRVCAYEDVAYFLDKMNMQFFNSRIEQSNNGFAFQNISSKSEIQCISIACLQMHCRT